MYELTEQMAQQLVDFVAGETGFNMIVCDTNGVIIGDSRKERLGVRHAAAATIMSGEVDSIAVSHEEEIHSEQQMREGYNCVIKIDNERIGTFGISGAIETVKPIAKIAAAVIAARIKEMQHLGEIDRIKSEFISTAAHELRTPLSSVLGYAELLLHQETFGTFSAEEQRDFLEEIVKKAEVLAAIIDDLLDLSRIESGQIVRLTLAPALPGRLLEEVVEDFRRHNPDRRFELSLPPILPEISVDAAKVRQVLENLLGNAVKFSPQGSRIRVEALLHVDRIEIDVADEGIGMSSEVLTRIFDKFYRGVTDSAIAGLGLGMTIVKNIVEAHGGELRVESTPNCGTRVTFTLPLSPDHGHLDVTEGK